MCIQQKNAVAAESPATLEDSIEEDWFHRLLFVCAAIQLPDSRFTCQVIRYNLLLCRYRAFKPCEKELISH